MILYVCNSIYLFIIFMEIAALISHPFSVVWKAVAWSSC